MGLQWFMQWIKCIVFRKQTDDAGWNLREFFRSYLHDAGYLDLG